METLNNFLTYFNIVSLSDGSELTVGQFLGYVTTGFFALILTIVGIRCIMEFIKILTDWSRLR